MRPEQKNWLATHCPNGERIDWDDLERRKRWTATISIEDIEKTKIYIQKVAREFQDRIRLACETLDGRSEIVALYLRPEEIPPEEELLKNYVIVGPKDQPRVLTRLTGGQYSHPAGFVRK